MLFERKAFMNKREVEQILLEHGISVKKKFGQNFLLDKNVLTKIATSLNDEDENDAQVSVTVATADHVMKDHRIEESRRNGGQGDVAGGEDHGRKMRSRQRKTKGSSTSAIAAVTATHLPPRKR